ncbi:SNO glutamine amidotransferase family-domain-containing protein [Chytridium lagenaria]|nr:SNO glutamine amidotransferase family-domain-containing protein [Chytridium lagenaria]
MHEWKRCMTPYSTRIIELTAKHPFFWFFFFGGIGRVQVKEVVSFKVIEKKKFDANTTTTASGSQRRVKLGVLALQGAFSEHVFMLQRMTDKVESVVEVRKATDLEGLDGLVIPGGESTTMALVAERAGFMEPLRGWVHSGKPTWGTCAGMILLANGISHGKAGGQALIGGLDIQVKRNAFGTQMDSFEMKLDIPAIAGGPFHGIFIRAPIVEVLSGSEVEILAQLDGGKRGDSVVAVRQKHIMATAFHPELTQDDRLHRYFVDMVLAH